MPLSKRKNRQPDANATWLMVEQGRPFYFSSCRRRRRSKEAAERRWIKQEEQDDTYRNERDILFLFHFIPLFILFHSFILSFEYSVSVCIVSCLFLYVCLSTFLTVITCDAPVYWDSQNLRRLTATHIFTLKTDPSNWSKSFCRQRFRSVIFESHVSLRKIPEKESQRENSPFS